MVCLRRHRSSLGIALCCARLMACGDDTVSQASNSGTATGGTSTTDGPPATVSVDDTAGTFVGTGTGTETGIEPDSTGSSSGSSSDSGTDTSSDSGTDTGVPVEPGHVGAAFVNAGTHEAASPGYRMLFTFGQSTQNQNGMTSPGYRMRGGLVPATQ